MAMSEVLRSFQYDKFTNILQVQIQKGKSVQVNQQKQMNKFIKLMTSWKPKSLQLNKKINKQLRYFHQTTTQNNVSFITLASHIKSQMDSNYSPNFNLSIRVVKMDQDFAFQVEGQQIFFFCNQQFYQNNSQIFENLSLFISLLTKSRNTLQYWGIKRIIQFMLKNYRFYGRTPSPSGILLSLTHFTFVNYKNIAASKMLLDAEKYTFNQFKINQKQFYIQDFLASPIRWPAPLLASDKFDVGTIQRYITAIDNKNEVSIQQVQNLTNIINQYLKETQQNMKQLQIKSKGKQIYLALQMKQQDQKKQNVQKQINKINSQNFQLKKRSQIVSKQIQKMNNKQLPVAISKDRQILRNDILISTKYFKVQYQAFSKPFTIVSNVTQQDLQNKFPYDISLSIIQTQRKRMFYKSIIQFKLAFAMTSILKEGLNLTNDSVQVRNDIQQYQQQISLLIQKYSTQPINQISILIAKGQRIKLYQQQSSTNQQMQQALTKQTQFLNKNIQIFGQLMVSSFGNVGNQIQQMYNNININKLFLSNLSNSIQKNFLKSAQQLKLHMSETYNNRLGQLQNIGQYFQSIGSSINNLVTIIQQQTSQINNIFDQLVQMRKQMLQLRIQIIKISNKADKIYSQTSNISQTIINFFQKLKSNGLENIIRAQSQNFEKINESKTKSLTLNKQISQIYNKTKQFSGNIKQQIQSMYDISKKNIGFTKQQLKKKQNQFQQIPSFINKLNFSNIRQTLKNKSKQIQQIPNVLSMFGTNISKQKQSIQQIQNKMNQIPPKIQSFGQNIDKSKVALDQVYNKINQSNKINIGKINQINAQSSQLQQLTSKLKLNYQPQTLNKVLQYLQKSKQLNGLVKQDLTGQIKQIKQQLNNILNSLKSSGSNGGSGGSGGNDQQKQLIKKQLIQKNKQYQQLQKILQLILQLVYQTFHDQQKFMIQYAQDLERNGVQRKKVDFVIKQLDERFKGQIQIIDKYIGKVTGYKQLKRFKQKYQQNVFQAYLKSNKRIKV